MVVIRLADSFFKVELVDEFDEFNRVVGDATKFLVDVVNLVNQSGNID